MLPAVTSWPQTLSADNDPFGGHIQLSPAHKNKAGLLAEQAAKNAQSWRRISTFVPAENSAFRGFASPTLMQGASCKLRVLRCEDGRVYALREARLTDKAASKAARPLPDGSVEAIQPLHGTSPKSYLREHEALTRTHSCMMPEATFYEPGKSRFWDVVPLFDGDLFSLSESFCPVQPPRGLLLEVAFCVLTEIVKLSSIGLQHHDIKPENILWRRAGELALADYGLAGKAGERSHSGTGGYRDPAVFLAPHRTGRADLYGLGMTFVHLLQPNDFATFPMAYLVPDPSAPAQVGSAAVPADTGRQVATQACRVYARWRQTRGRGAVQDHVENLAARLEKHFLHARVALGDALAQRIFFQWLQPDPRHRGSAAQHLTELQVAYPPQHPARARAHEELARYADQDPGRQRLAATVTALERYAACYFHLQALSKLTVPRPSLLRHEQAICVTWAAERQGQQGGGATGPGPLQPLHGAAGNRPALLSRRQTQPPQGLLVGAGVTRMHGTTSSPLPLQVPTGHFTATATPG